MRIRLKSFILAFLLFLFVCSDILGQYIGIADYMDEAAAILFGLFYIVWTMTYKAKKSDLKIIGLVVVLLIIEFSGKQFSGVEVALIYLLFDAINIIVLAILGAEFLFSSDVGINYIIIYLAKMQKILVTLLLVFMILNLLANVGMYTDYRYGIRAYNFLFSRVGELYGAAILWIIVFTVEYYIRKNKSSLWFVLLSLLNICSTLRSRAIAFALLYLLQRGEYLRDVTTCIVNIKYRKASVLRKHILLSRSIFATAIGGFTI